MSGKFLLALFAVLCAVSPGVAQIQSDDVVRITTNLVQVDVVVTKKGKLIKDLKAEDFEIFEDGRRQKIISFAYVGNTLNNAGEAGTTSSKTKNDPNAADPNVAEPPPVPTKPSRRTIAFVVDDYGLTAHSIAHVRRQLRKFIDEKLKPNDLVAIVRTSRARRDQFQLTSDRSRINQAWEQVEFNQCSRVGLKPVPNIGDDANVARTC